MTTSTTNPVAAYFERRALTNDPKARADIIQRREAGESLAQIGKVYGVSRERIRQLCDMWGAVAPKKVSCARAAVELVLSYAVDSLSEAAREGNCSTDALKAELRRQGYDVEQVKADLMAHRYDGQSWGDWSALDGGYVYESQNRRWVRCRCVCGTERLVSAGNLLNRMTLGCGCRNSTDRRRRIPWVCVETGERVENTAALAKHLGINQLMLYRRLRRGEPYIDSQERRWDALPEQAAPHRPDEDHLKKLKTREGLPVVCVETGERWPSGSKAAAALGVNAQTFRDALRRRCAYSVNGLTYKRA